jgi:hypothetical protein
MNPDIGFLTVFVVKTLTTAGATFLTTGEKLVAILDCRSSGASFAETETVGRLLSDRSNFPLAATQPTAPTATSNATIKLFFIVILINLPF